MRTWILVLIAVGLVLISYVEFRRRLAVQEAERQAALHILSQFHVGYLADRRLDREEYLGTLKALGDKHPDMQTIQRYIQDAEAEIRGINE